MLKFFKLPFCLITAISMMGFQCHKDFILPKPTYDFAEKISLFPSKKVYAINDTIWVQFQTTTKTLFDRLSNTRVQTDTTYLPLNFRYRKRYPDNISRGDIFCSTVVSGGVNTNVTYPLFYNVVYTETPCNNNPYFIKVAFVPKTTGIYFIQLPIGEINRCPNNLSFDYAKYSMIFDLADCNKDIYLSIPPQSRGGEGFVEESIDKKETFVFRVQ